MPTALITGGTTGIGKATAQLLNARGYRVAVTGQNPESIAAAERELPEGTLVIRANSRSLTDTDAMIGEVRDQFGSLDLLFLNAGISRPLPVAAVTEEDFDDLADINFKGSYFTLQKALPLLVDGGSIVLTVGIAARHGGANFTLTAATRGALLALMPSLALELAPRRIRVNAVSPGAVDTPIWDKLGVPSEMREAASASIPFGRFGTSDEVAEVVAFLASSAASYITGQEITVAGGGGLSM
jgi:NAD(P)-dependent dehydrogenase (short-subunit alcohol dehydrogenase family)